LQWECHKTKEIKILESEKLPSWKVTSFFYLTKLNWDLNGNSLWNLTSSKIDNQFWTFYFNSHSMFCSSIEKSNQVAKITSPFLVDDSFFEPITELSSEFSETSSRTVSDWTKGFERNLVPVFETLKETPI